MSGGRQKRPWSSKPENLKLMQRVRDAHFQHLAGVGGSGLTYQSCRFCGNTAETNADNHDDKCWFSQNRGETCRGLWKYNVRHYICSACRRSVLLGLKPGAKGR